MREHSRLIFAILVFAFGLEVASAAVIHDWTISTPLGDFGYLELGEDGPTEGYFLLGELGNIQTSVGGSAVLTGAVLTGIATILLAVVVLSGRRMLPGRRHRGPPSVS